MRSPLLGCSLIRHPPLPRLIIIVAVVRCCSILAIFGILKLLVSFLHICKNVITIIIILLRLFLLLLFLLCNQSKVLLEFVKIADADAYVSVEVAREELPIIIFGILDDLDVVLLPIEEDVVLLDHLDDELVVAAHVRDVFGSGAPGPENVGAHGDRHVVSGHFVEGLVLDDHFEDINVEFKRVEVDLWQFVDPKFQLEQREDELDVGVVELRTLSFDVGFPEELIVKVVRD